MDFDGLLCDLVLQPFLHCVPEHKIKTDENAVIID
jgi:hypothetical protein